MLYLERPSVIAARERTQYERAVASRIARDDPDAPWLTLPQAIIDLDALIVDADPEHIAFLEESTAVSSMSLSLARAWQGRDPSKEGAVDARFAADA